MSRAGLAAALVFLAACGVPAGATRPPEPAPSATPALSEAERALLAAIEPRSDRREPLRSLGEALADCTGEYTSCSIRGAAAFDPESGRWVILSVDYEESGPDAASLELVGVAERRRLVATGLDAAGIEALRAALAPYAALRPPEDLVREEAIADFSLNAYAPLVLLGAPLEGWMLHVETTDLDTSEHVLHLSRRDGSERHVLGRRAAGQGPCDGAGWYCERVSEEDECTPEQLRAEGRLCVQPLGIESVGLAPDGASLVILGTEQIAGHGGYPAFAWVAALPPQR